MARPSASTRWGVTGLPYGWHEWGCYIGLFGFFVLVGGLVLRGERRSIPIRVAGLLFMVLGFGAFA